MGLIRGAAEENAIVLTNDGIKNPPLRFADEFVRHKVLDLIGDLALLGHPLLGRIEADRAGHAMHAALVSRLLRDHSLWEFATLPAAGYEPAHAAAFSPAGQTV
jgi:UDP-3-O-[3-hydroxymyristoyl] N-acetylglucosamine deacetylase